MTNIKLLLLSAVLLPSPALAAEEPGFFKDTLISAGHVISSPARIRNTDLPILGALTAGGLVLYSLDTQISRGFAKNQTSRNDNIAKNLEKIGNGGYLAAAVGVYGGIGLLASDERMEATALLSAESFLAANAAGTLLKYGVGRARPYTGAGKHSFKPFSLKSDYTSFPSGHTISAFSVASVFAARSDSYIVKGALYAAASSVAFQRVYAEKHWASDVFAGAAIGTAVGRWVANPERKNRGSAMLIPAYSHEYAGATLLYNF